MNFIVPEFYGQKDFHDMKTEQAVWRVLNYCSFFFHEITVKAYWDVTNIM